MRPCVTVSATGVFHPALTKRHTTDRHRRRDPARPDRHSLTFAGGDTAGLRARVALGSFFTRLPRKELSRPPPLRTLTPPSLRYPYPSRHNTYQERLPIGPYMKRLRMDNGEVADADGRANEDCPECGRPGAREGEDTLACYNCHERWSA